MLWRLLVLLSRGSPRIRIKAATLHVSCSLPFPGYVVGVVRIVLLESLMVTLRIMLELVLEALLMMVMLLLLLLILVTVIESVLLDRGTVKNHRGSICVSQGKYCRCGGEVRERCLVTRDQ